MIQHYALRFAETDPQGAADVLSESGIAGSEFDVVLPLPMIDGAPKLARLTRANFSLIHVRTERRCGQSLLVEEVHIRNVCPAVAHGFRAGQTLG